MIEYKDTSSKELRLAFAWKDLDVTPLDVIEKKTVGDFEFGILGASHYIKFKNGNEVIFTEVFSCAEFSSEDTSIIHLQGAKGIDFGTNIGLKYQFNSRVVEFDELTYSEMIQKYESNERYGLLFEFPYVGNPKFTPVTLITNKKEGDALVFETLHAYPEENKLVITKTVIVNESN